MGTQSATYYMYDSLCSTKMTNFNYLPLTPNTFPCRHNTYRCTANISAPFRILRALYSSITTHLSRNSCPGRREASRLSLTALLLRASVSASC